MESGLRYAGIVAAVTAGAALAVAVGTHTTNSAAEPIEDSAPVVGANSVSDSFNGYPTTAMSDGMKFGPWHVVFAGYGSVSVINGKLRLAPKAPTSTGETHAALVTSTTSLASACVAVSTRLRTTQQLRTGSAPNPWEVGWLVWDYTDNDHFSYLAIKPNGWELGKRDPAYPGGQRFLATGGVPATPVGTWRNLSVKRSYRAGAAALTVTIDGKPVTTFKDSERPYTSGRVGFYTEDAVADWDSVTARTC